MLGYARLYWLCLAVRIDTVVVAVDMDTAEEAMLICRKMRCMSYAVAGGIMLSAVTQGILVLCCNVFCLKGPSWPRTSV